MPDKCHTHNMDEQTRDFDTQSVQTTIPVKFHNTGFEPEKSLPEFKHPAKKEIELKANNCKEKHVTFKTSNNNITQ